jgi:phage tail protein X
LVANRGLADYGAKLPAGLSITLPEITAPAKAKGVKLWE